MTTGIGGSTAELELEAMRSMRGDVAPITIDEPNATMRNAPSGLSSVVARSRRPNAFVSCNAPL